MPLPALALLWFPQLRGPFAAVGQDKEGDVMLSLGGEEVVAEWAEADRAEGEAGLLLDLPAGARLDRLAELEVAPREGPLPGAVGAATAAQEESAFAEDEDCDPDPGECGDTRGGHGVVRGCQLARSKTSRRVTPIPAVVVVASWM